MSVLATPSPANNTIGARVAVGGFYDNAPAEGLAISTRRG